jgi:hypothetical protein
MACSLPQQTFNKNLNLRVSINVSGTTATLWLQNAGQNILRITRILLGVTYPGFAVVLYLRPPGLPGAWSWPWDTLEQGYGAGFYTLPGLPPGTVVEAQAEYIEVQDRSRSCQAIV